MTGNEVALDTSAAIKLLNDAGLASRFLARVGKVHLSSIAAGELLYGAMNSARHLENVPRYKLFVEHCTPLPVSLSTAETYAPSAEFENARIPNPGCRHLDRGGRR